MTGFELNRDLETAPSRHRLLKLTYRFRASTRPTKDIAFTYQTHVFISGIPVPLVRVMNFANALIAYCLCFSPNLIVDLPLKRYQKCYIGNVFRACYNSLWLLGSLEYNLLILFFLSGFW